jgi:hypothetical protein
MPAIIEEQTIQTSKEKGQKKRQSNDLQNNTQKTKDRETRTPHCVEIADQL